VADGATIAAGHQDERQFQRHHHVKDGAVLVERRHDAAYALDQQDFAALLERALAIFHHAVDIDAAALALRRQVRRERGAKAPRRNPLDLLRRQRKSQRREQDAGIARGRFGRVVAAHDRLHGVDLVAQLPQMADQRGGYEGLSDIVPGRGDEYCSHGPAPLGAA
jgi:hypothetical protein